MSNPPASGNVKENSSEPSACASIVAGPNREILAGCVHEFIERQAERTPGKVALKFENRELTYREMDERANQIAHYLRKKGVAPENAVALAFERSLELIVGLLAIWKAGAAYVPIDPEFPLERVAYTLADSCPKILLTHQTMRHLFDPQTPPIVDLDRDAAAIAAEPRTNPPHTATAENLAQILYTSGSTGKPKGVEITHRGLVNFMQWLWEKPAIGAHDVVAATTTPAFDTSGVELFMPLTMGSRILIIGRATIQTPRSYFKLLEDECVTVSQGTPTALRWFTEYGWPGKRDMKIISGGEELKRDLADQLIPKCAELWNIYGPTEGTIWVTIGRIQAGRGPVPLGEPIQNTQIHILDADLKPVAIGNEGEVYIAGACVARGYLERPAMTAQRFLTIPIGGKNVRMYKTGDLARYTPSGVLEFLGRADHQIKINGARIEPGEIEAAILEFPGARQALVVAREDVPGEKRLVAYVVMSDGAQFNSGELRKLLAAKLPRYAVPASIVALSDFPKLINGKINREALPRPGLPAGKAAF